MAAGYVYLIGVVNGCYKIGRSADPARRANDLASGSPVKLRVIHQIATANPRWLESHLHRVFVRRKVKREWFCLSDLEVYAFCSVQKADVSADLPPGLQAADRLRPPKRDVGRDVVPGFGPAVRAERESQGYTLAELAAAAGTSVSALSQVERGVRAPSLRFALAVADALGSRLEVLLGRGDDPLDTCVRCGRARRDHGPVRNPESDYDADRLECPGDGGRVDWASFRRRRGD